MGSLSAPVLEGWQIGKIIENKEEVTSGAGATFSHTHVKKDIFDAKSTKRRRINLCEMPAEVEGRTNDLGDCNKCPTKPRSRLLPPQAHLASPHARACNRNTIKILFTVYAESISRREPLLQPKRTPKLQLLATMQFPLVPLSFSTTISFVVCRKIPAHTTL